MSLIPKNKQLEQIAQAIFKEDSKRIPTELLPLMVVFGLISICTGIFRLLLMRLDNGNNK